MTEYIIKIGFWLRAYDGFTVEADSDAEAIEKAKAAAAIAMESMAHPEHIEIEERREGIIAFIDRITAGGRNAVIEDVEFDDDRIHLLPAARAPHQPDQPSPAPRRTFAFPETDMADYLTHFSCLLDVGTPENATRALDLYNKLSKEGASEEPPSEGFLLSIQPEHGGTQLWMRDDGTGDPERLIQFVKLCAAKFGLKGLWGFQYANTCSKPLLDGFGGGAHVLDLGTGGTVAWTYTDGWLAEVLDGGDPDA